MPKYECYAGVKLSKSANYNVVKSYSITYQDWTKLSTTVNPQTICRKQYL